jgi:hypothetical protein
MMWGIPTWGWLIILAVVVGIYVVLDKKVKEKENE